MFLVSVPRIFKSAMRACGETNSKVACEICRKLYHSIFGMFWKIVLLEISKNSFLTGVATLQRTGAVLKTNSCPNC